MSDFAFTLMFMLILNIFLLVMSVIAFVGLGAITLVVTIPICIFIWTLSSYAIYEEFKKMKEET